MKNKSEVFPASGYPTYLEWYRCYDDPARSEWIDGMELRRHPEWDGRQKDKWHFFYRPIPRMVGRPQWKMIRDLQGRIATARETLRKRQQRMIAFTIFGVLLAAISAWNSVTWLMYVSILGLCVAGLEFIAASRSLQKDISGCEARIAALEGEILHLLTQIPKPPNAQDFEQWLADELRGMERKCLGELINELDLDQERLEELLRHQKLKEGSPAHGLLIEGWGLLQPVQNSGPFGVERTGKNRMIRDINAGIATWRVGRQGQPIYRALFLQYVFLLRTNISVSSFFYDFVTRKCYGRRGETFEYGHVTNFMVRELDGDDGSLGLEEIRGGSLSRLIEHLLDEQLSEVALAVASGSHFRCVLIDDAVIKGMNDWLKADEKYARLAQGNIAEDDEAVSSSDLHKLARGNGNLWEQWKRERERWRKELLDELARERTELAQKSLGSAWKTLQQIRDGVEAYARAPFDDSVRWKNLARFAREPGVRRVHGP
jgi:hypothetical protein